MKIILFLFAVLVVLAGCAVTQSVPQETIETLVFLNRYGPDVDMTKALETGGLEMSPRSVSYVFSSSYWVTGILPRPRLSPLLFMDVEIVPELLNIIDDRMPKIADWVKNEEQNKKDYGDLTSDDLKDWMFFRGFESAFQVLGCILGCTFDDVWRAMRENDGNSGVLEKARRMVSCAKRLESGLLAVLGPEPEDAEKRKKINDMLDDFSKLKLEGTLEHAGIAFSPPEGMSATEYDRILEVWSTLVGEMSEDALPMVLKRLLNRDHPEHCLLLFSYSLGMVTQYENSRTWDGDEPMSELKNRMVNMLLEKEISRIETLVKHLRARWNKADK